MKVLADDLHARKRLVPKTNHHSADAAILDQQIGTPPDDRERQLQLGANPQQLPEIILAGGLGKKVRFASNPKRGAPGQRFVLANRRLRGNRRTKLFERR